MLRGLGIFYSIKYGFGYLEIYRLKNFIGCKIIKLFFEKVEIIRI